MYLLESKIENKLVLSKILFVWGWISSLLWTGTLLLYAMPSENDAYRRKRDFEIYVLVLIFFGVLALLGYLKLLISIWLKDMTKKARFINAFFENDLDGIIQANELGVVMGVSNRKAARELKKLKRMFMTGFEIKQSEQGTYVELESKKVKCTCKNCGGEIDKKIYFAGICPYCGSIDIFAQVISNDKIYSIQHVKEEISDSQNSNKLINTNDSSKAYFYITGDTDDSNKAKELFYLLVFGFSTFMTFVCMLLSLQDVFRGEAELSVPIGFVIIFMPLFIYNFIKHYNNYIYISSAKRFSKIAANASKPVVMPEVLFVENLKNMINQYSSRKKQFSIEKKISVFREMQKRGYIRHCSLIYNENEFTIGLSREIKKDSCPMCGAAISGALKDNASCKFCGYLIEDALTKK